MFLSYIETSDYWTSLYQKKGVPTCCTVDVPSQEGHTHGSTVRRHLSSFPRAIFFIIACRYSSRELVLSLLTYTSYSKHDGDTVASAYLFK